MLVRGCLFWVNNQKVNSCQAKKIWTTRESFCPEQRNFRQKIPWAQEILALPCFGQRGRLDTVWADSDARQAWNPQSGRCWCSSSHQHISTRSPSSLRLFGPLDFFLPRSSPVFLAGREAYFNSRGENENFAKVCFAQCSTSRLALGSPGWLSPCPK